VILITPAPAVSFPAAAVVYTEPNQASGATQRALAALTAAVAVLCFNAGSNVYCRTLTLNADICNTLTLGTVISIGELEFSTVTVVD